MIIKSLPYIIKFEYSWLAKSHGITFCKKANGYYYLSIIRCIRNGLFNSRGKTVSVTYIIRPNQINETSMFVRSISVARIIIKNNLEFI